MPDTRYPFPYVAVRSTAEESCVVPAAVQYIPGLAGSLLRLLLLSLKPESIRILGFFPSVIQLFLPVVALLLQAFKDLKMVVLIFQLVFQRSLLVRVEL